jgi:cohesin complex subunit SA-1/2
VTNYDIEDQDSAATTLSQIQAAFQQEQGGEYPLTSKKAAFRRFRQNLSSFLESLVSELSTKDLFVLDPPLIENIQSWLAAMSTSTLRQFRHTATVIELDLMTQMSIAAADIRKTNGTTNRQLEAEGSKSVRNEARIQSLDQKLKEGEERREAIEEVIKDMFNQ